MDIEINHPSFNNIVDIEAGIEQVATGFDFLEGPIWHPEYRSVIFSDIMGNSIYSWSKKDGVVQRRRNSYMANGNAYDHQGRFITCEHATSRVTRTDMTNDLYEVLATHYEGKQLNSPNDVVVKRDGMIYFTDPTYGRGSNNGVPRDVELDFRGVYRIYIIFALGTLYKLDIPRDESLLLQLTGLVRVNDINLLIKFVTVKAFTKLLEQVFHATNW